MRNDQQEVAEDAEGGKRGTPPLSRIAMHHLYNKASGLTEQVIAAAIEVHRDKGPGLLESLYEWCLKCELELRGLTWTAQGEVAVAYKSFVRTEILRFDLLVEECVLVVIKAIDAVLPIHKAQLLSYTKLLDVPIGLLINFNELQVVDGIHRLVLKGADGSVRR
jgi:GxxExxY protein